ncbi:MAG: BatA domain-containing protein [Janthinobacterium lividum]
MFNKLTFRYMYLLFPGFLWSLLGIGIPLLIHLLQLRRPQRVQFTNTSFIQEIEFRVGRQRLQDWLILGLRILTIGSLALLFCQPYVPPKAAVQVESTLQAQIFIDSSPSMQVLTKNEGSLANRTVAMASSLGDSYHNDVRLQLLGYSRQAVTKNAFRAALLNTALYNQMLGWGAPIVKQAWEAERDEALYILSDFQKNEVPPRVFAQLANEREIVLIPQRAKPAGNIYVDSVWIDDAFVRARINFGLHIRLRNGGNEPVSDCPVKVFVRGQQVAALQATVAVGQLVEKIVQLQLPNERLVTGQVVLADEPVAFDNTYNFALQPTTAVRVMELGPAPVAQAAYQNEPLFRYSYARAQQADFGKLQQANLVLLSEPAALDAGLRAALVSVVRRGGSVVIVPPALPQAHGAYEQLLQTLGVGSAQWEHQGSGQPVLQELAMPNLRSSFFKEVFGAQSRQVAMPEVSPVLQLASGGTDILRLRDGTAFLTEFEQGLGRVYIFSTPFDKKYSDFTGHALFVPVLYRLAMLSYRNDQPLAYRVGQQTIRLRVPATKPASADEAAYRLVRDSLTLVPGQRLLGQQVQLQIPSELTKPGFYQLQRQGKPVATLAFNGNKKESELAAYSVAELRQLVGPNRPNVHVLDVDEQPAALQNYRAEQTGRPLWHYCLLLALACLLVESALLRWGRRAQALRPASS